MRKKERGLVTALLCVVIVLLSGCGKEEALYTTGLTVEKESETAPETASETDRAAYAAENSSGPVGADADPAGGTAAGIDLSASGTEPAQTEASLGYVYVCGAVAAAGVYPIEADMRVCDAIELAGGFSAEADREWLNQASAVRDGQKLYVYTTEETAVMKEAGMTAEGMDGDSSVSGSSDLVEGTTSAAAGASDGSGAAGSDILINDGTGASGSGDTASDGKVNINTATREELMSLPGIGESKADAIITYRSEHGPFASIEEIQNISGIKSGVFSQIKDFITV